MGAFRSRNYRNYWAGFLTSIIGWQIQAVALGWLVLERTHSPLYLGLVSMSQAVATISLSLLGGVIADRVDRRRLLIFTQLGAFLCSFAIASLVFFDVVQLWHLLLIAFLFGSLQAFDQPSRQALIPHLVERPQLMNAIALGSAVWQSSRIIGPTVAGLLLAFVGTAACFYVTSVGFLVMVAALSSLRLGGQATAASRGGMLGDLKEGLGYIRGNRLFLLLIGMTFFNSLFGMSYVILMPVFAKDVLGVGSQGLGYLLSASGIGALTGTIIVSTLGGVRRKGLLVGVAAAVFGLLLIAFSQSPWFWLSLPLLGLMGAASSLYMITINTVLQAAVPDQLRGRVMGVYSLTWSLMPLGGMQSGTIANFFGAPLAVTIGGSLVVLMALWALAFQPRLRTV
ncbi:MAG: MFS transporter [Dehalococcoidia bacterium]|nr:MFS transporter [Dehalococcoidia bacterium]